MTQTDQASVQESTLRKYSSRQPNSDPSRSTLTLEQTLRGISKREGEYARFNASLADAVKVELAKFEEYNGFMQSNDIYYIASILDPRIKCQQLKKNVIDHEKIIQRVRTFLKQTYPPELELPTHSSTEHKSLEYRFLEEFETVTASINASDIDRYLDTPPITFKLNKSEDQTQWTLNWWDGNRYEYPCMAQAARDYLPIPASEVDVERLFNVGRDILGVRRFAISGNTLRTVMMLKDVLRRKEIGQL